MAGPGANWRIPLPLLPPSCQLKYTEGQDLLPGAARVAKAKAQSSNGQWAPLLSLGRQDTQPGQEEGVLVPQTPGQPGLWLSQVSAGQVCSSMRPLWDSVLSPTHGGNLIPASLGLLFYGKENKHFRSWSLSRSQGRSVTEARIPLPGPLGLPWLPVPPARLPWSSAALSG